MDALTHNVSNAYIMTPFKIDASGKIVKMDASLVELESCQQNTCRYFAAFP